MGVTGDAPGKGEQKLCSVSSRNFMKRYCSNAGSLTSKYGGTTAKSVRSESTSAQGWPRVAGKWYLEMFLRNERVSFLAPTPSNVLFRGQKEVKTKKNLFLHAGCSKSIKGK